MSSSKPHLAFYGVGQFGLKTARIALEKGFPIVAAYNRAGEKVGKDIATLAGWHSPIGVQVEDCEQADFSRLDADICIVAMTDFLDQNLPAYRRLLGAGVNVLSHATQGYYPWGTNVEAANEIDALAKANGVTYTGTGIWDMSRIWAGIMVAAPCTDITHFFHRSITDAQRLGPKLMPMCGVGHTQDDFHQRFVVNEGPAGGLYKTIPHQVLSALGYTVTKVSERREPVLSDQDYYCQLIDKTFAAGTTLGCRIIIDVETAEGPKAEAHIELRVFNEGEVEHMMWQVDGKPGSKVTVERDDSVHASAGTLFNRIPDVINAEPGIKVISELGLMKHSALVGNH